MQFAPFYPVLHRVLSPLFIDCLWTGHRGDKTIALTFDDGPHPDYTPPLLTVLDQYHIPASFFWLGSAVQHFPEVARAIYDRGHWVGLHGYHHRAFPRLSLPALKLSLEQSQEAIAHACHLDLSYVAQHVRDVRPPNGVFTPKTLEALRAWGYRPVMWSVVPEDWVYPGIEVAVNRVLTQTQCGSVIVLHDGYYGGRDVATITSRLIPALLEQGYQFVTIDDLWRQRQAGATVSTVS